MTKYTESLCPWDFSSIFNHHADYFSHKYEFNLILELFSSTKKKHIEWQNWTLVLIHEKIMERFGVDIFYEIILKKKLSISLRSIHVPSTHWNWH